jgi:hypothetical protein
MWTDRTLVYSLIILAAVCAAVMLFSNGVW